MTQPSLIPAICPYCGVGCGLYIAVEDGRAVGLEYMPEHPVSEGSLCPKGNAVLEILEHPERLRHPMKKANNGPTKISSVPCASPAPVARIASVVARSARKRPSPLLRRLR